MLGFSLPELRRERVVLLVEIDVLLRRYSESEFGCAAVVRNSEVTLANNVHAYQNVGANKSTSRDPNSTEPNSSG